jgi:hypothetical protein
MVDAIEAGGGQFNPAQVAPPQEEVAAAENVEPEEAVAAEEVQNSQQAQLEEQQAVEQAPVEEAVAVEETQQPEQPPQPANNSTFEAVGLGVNFDSEA